MRTFTPEQRAAIADRSGPALLAAGAGSGKTAVMVERFAEAVRHDEVPVSAILTLTFTEKAAAELRERIRRRFAEAGEAEHARAVDAAWIGTIHGFCARLLRAQPLAAGLDPRFTVLEEGAARRLAQAAFEPALEGWVAEHGAVALDVAAAYGRELELMITDAHAALRSRGHTHPRLRLPPPVDPPGPAALGGAAAAAARCIGVANGVRVRQALDALEAAERIVAAAGVPLPSDLDAAKLGAGARALEHDDCAAYREVWATYRAACADFHARPVLVLLDDLLDRFARAYEAAKAGRAGVDFEDLELRVRDLLAAEPALRERWAARFALLMIDEFQDTNPLQLEVLEQLERGNLFVVGDESQSIYGFRHADVGIFRARRAALDAGRVRGLTVNFRSRPEILDVVNAAFAPLLGDGFVRLVPGRGPEELRLFAPGPPEAPRVELLVTEHAGWDERAGELGLGALATQPWRRAEARAVAARLREEVDQGRALRDLVVLVRATSSLRLYEQALEDQGLATYVVGGRGYWAQEQVRDGIAYLGLLANPRDEAALYGALASPFCGASADALVLLAEAGRREGGGAWAALLRAAGGDRPPSLPDAAVAGDDVEPPAIAGEWQPPGAWLGELPPEEAGRLRFFARFAAAERGRAERLPAEVLLERAIAATGYDLAILARAGGDRRLANLRKLMRLAREYERAEGRDLRGFLTYAAEQDLAEAREGEAALESDGLNAVRLMTIHRAKGLEFPVVCVADLGRSGVRGRGRLLVAPDGRAGLRLATLAGGEPVGALGYDDIAAELTAAESAEERRLLYVAATRAEERLILSGGVDTEKWPAPRPGGPPLDWLAPALLGDAPAALEAARAGDGESVAGCGDGAIAVHLVSPATLPPETASPAPRARPSAPGALPAEPKVIPVAARARPARRRLSYSALQAYARCPYRFYLQRELRMPRVKPPPDPDAPATAAITAADLSTTAAAGGAGAVTAADVAAPGAAAAITAANLARAAGEAPEGLDALERGSLIHVLLEDLDFARPEPPTAEAVEAAAAAAELPLGPGDVEDVRAQVAAFAASPLCARLAASSSVRREAGFAFALEPGGGGPLVTGLVDVLAREPDGAALVVDYKSHRLEENDSPAELIEREYATQRMVYALAALEDGAPRVEVAYCLLDRPAEPVTATFTQDDAPALSDALLRLAAGVLEEEWPVAPVPHRDLCADCPGRAALCSWPERMTLRSTEEAYLTSAGSFAGSSGPS